MGRQQHEWEPPQSAWCQEPHTRILLPTEDVLLDAELLLSPSGKGGDHGEQSDGVMGRGLGSSQAAG